MTDRLRAALGGTAARAGLVTPDLEPWAVEARWADERSQFLELDGARVHYRDEGAVTDSSSRRSVAGGTGDPPTLLLVHGTFASLHTWDPWVDRLADEYRVVRVDLPGHGLTGPHAGGYRMADLVTFLEAVREALVAVFERDLDPTHRHDELADLSVPTLIQWGEHDEWIPRTVGGKFADSVPDAVFRTYRAGHVPMEEVPDATAADLRTFLDSHV